ncbi:MAG: hypothetical protein ABSG31_18585 [Tepidisphaeraceae bacterium]
MAIARVAYRRISRAVWVARTDGMILIAFGALTIIGGIGSISAMAAGAVLAVIGWIEWRGSDRLRKFDPRALSTLMLNQLVLGGLLILYSLVQLVSEMMGRGLTADLNGDLSEFGVVDTGELHALVMLFYVALIFIAVPCMGGLAYYYFTRQKYVDAYLKETPDWIVAMQKSGVTL